MQLSELVLQEEMISSICRSEIEFTIDILHVSNVPEHILGREYQFENIKTFIENKIIDKCSGCMYVSGVSGTGKTATVSKVIRTLHENAKKGKLTMTITHDPRKVRTYHTYSVARSTF